MLLTGPYSQTSANGMKSSPCPFSSLSVTIQRWKSEFEKLYSLTLHRETTMKYTASSFIFVQEGLYTAFPKDKGCHTETQDCPLVHVRCMTHICYVNEAQL